ncbi:nuclear transport factor 2 family protein [Streptomyces sp. 4503]|uniref:Nuclear transport factor 2 family protein n=1 Tax=Streptomyces niphimycinicus TaxID=2842201 RepID=A0ABS6CFF3_9ACTN|nr:nuclear transport factor 2 family protein [Streptomyces niphimycinicus]MBU3865657.1 nuclear transport factor 2 family protein [Streptomyces niphimycinicus]
MNDEVLQAADAVVAAFGEGRLDDYFAAFAPDATFVFHTTSERLNSTAEYRALWDRWVAEDGFRVLACVSTDRLVQLLGETAVFTHLVKTTVSTTAGEETTHERETIVFRRQTPGHWLAVHEHLSAAPGTSMETER